MDRLEQTADRLAALGNPTRLAIYRLLVRAGHDGMTVGRVQEVLATPGSTLSHHLKMLRSVGLIDQTRDGASLICTACFDVMDDTIGFLVDECCSDAASGSRPGPSGAASHPRR